MQFLGLILFLTSRSNLGYRKFTSEVINGHWMSKDIKVLIFQILSLGPKQGCHCPPKCGRISSQILFGRNSRRIGRTFGRIFGRTFGRILYNYKLCTTLFRGDCVSMENLCCVHQELLKKIVFLIFFNSFWCTQISFPLVHNHL